MWIQRVRSGVVQLAYSADGQSLYVLDTGGVLNAWDTQTHRCSELAKGYSRRIVRGLHPLADGRLILRTDRFISFDRAGKVATSVEPRYHVCEQVCPDGRVYAISHTDRWAIVQWDSLTGTGGTAFTVPQLAGGTISPYWFALAPDGQSIVVLFPAAGPYMLMEVGADNGLDNPQPLKGLKPWSCARFSPDGRTVAFFGRHPSLVTLLDVPTRAVRAQADVCHFLNGNFACNQPLQLFAGLNNEKVLTLYSLETGRPVRSLDFALGRNVNSFAFSPDGLTCAVGGSNKQFAVFDVDV